MATALRRAPVSLPRVSVLAVVVVPVLALVILQGLAFDGPVTERSRALPGAVRAFFEFATRFGKSDWLLIPSIVVAVLVAFGDWRRPGRAIAAAWQEIGAFAGTFFVAIALPGLINDIIKPLVGRARPNSLVDGGAAFAPFTLGYANASFPSGHADTMAAFAVVMMLAFGARSLPIVVAALVVAMSRVVIGVHYFSDMVAGILLGGAVAFLVVRWAAAAGVGFRLAPSGMVRPRLQSVRRVLRRPGGVGAMLTGLWIAIAGR